MKVKGTDKNRNQFLNLVSRLKEGIKGMIQKYLS